MERNLAPRRFCKIIVIEGKQYLATPDGEKLPNQVSTLAIQNLDFAIAEHPLAVAVVVVMVELENTIHAVNTPKE